MKKSLVSILFVIAISAMFLTGCSSSTTNNDNKANINASESEKDTLSKEADKSISSIEDSDIYESDSSSYVPSVSFTNAYGTPTTICAHSGCSNYIASSGDTNCCTLHSNRCLECNKFIDEDAMYCMSCLSKASNSITADYNSGYGAGYGYDNNDPYYSANDYNGDGRLSDEEFQNAINDAINEYGYYK